MPKTKEQKIQTVKELSERLGKSKTAIFADFKGLKVNESYELRNKCKEQGIDVEVIKKTLLKRSFEKAGIADIDPSKFEGGILIFLGYDDEVAPAKAVFDYAKEHGALKITGGIMGGRYADKAIIESLAKLPSKQELLAKLVRSIKSPISGLVNVLAGNLRGLVNVLNALKESKS